MARDTTLRRSQSEQAETRTERDQRHLGEEWVGIRNEGFREHQWYRHHFKDSNIHKRGNPRTTKSRKSSLCTATSPLCYSRAAEEDYGPTSQMAVVRKL